MTYTCALLEVPLSAFEAVKERIAAVNQNGDYDHMFHRDVHGGREGIDLTHIMIVPGAAPNSFEQLMLTGGFQDGVMRWVLDCFTLAIAEDMTERADRFGEEALELMQAAYSMTGDNFATRAHALVDYVAKRPVGDIEQEIGGVAVTLAALANTRRLNIGMLANLELARITEPEMLLKIRTKQASKPTGSALPVSDGPSLKHALDNLIRGAEHRNATAVTIPLASLKLMAADDGENHVITVSYHDDYNEGQPFVADKNVTLAESIKADLLTSLPPASREGKPYRILMPGSYGIDPVAYPVVRLHNSDRDDFVFVVNPDGKFYVLSRDADRGGAVSPTMYLRSGAFDTFEQAHAAYGKLEYYEGIEWFIVTGDLKE